MKNIFLKDLRLHINLLLSLCFCLALVLIRVKITQSVLFLFLIWNLFLASIPFALSSLLKSNEGLYRNKGILAIAFCAWLLFLPNAPYILTDLIHLKWQAANLLWFDALMIVAFALNGLLLGVLSCRDMRKFLSFHFPKYGVNLIMIATYFLCGFGIYLGRFLRWNSWDILQHPLALFKTIFTSTQNIESWSVTIGFGVFLWLCNGIVSSIQKEN